VTIFNFCACLDESISNPIKIAHKVHTHKYPPHVKDLLLGTFPPASADNYLWKNWNNSKFQSPVYNGVHGSFWTPPLAAVGNGGFKIASPHPKPKKIKIIAHDLPPHTISGSSFDLPKRKDIVQISLPVSRQKKIQYEIDPKKKNSHFGKLSYFGSQRVIKPKPIGLKFIELNLSPKKINEIKNDALRAAKTAEKNAIKISSQITKNPLAKVMVIPIFTTNKREHPDLKINYKNKALAKRKKKLKKLALN